MKKERVILTEADNEVGRSVEASLKRLGMDVFPFRCRLRIKDERNYINELKKNASDLAATMIIPVFFPEVVARHADEFPGITVLTDSAGNLEMLDNKLESSRLAERLGILQPASYATVDAVEKYPVVFKRVSGHGGESVYFPKKRESLEHLVATSIPESYIITSLVEGTEVSVDALIWGDFFFAGAYKVLLPRAKGVSIMRKSIKAPEIIAAARKILEAAGYRGVCGMDFIVDKEGRAWFLECNPRFSGGLSLQLAAGFDIPAALLRLNAGEKISPEDMHFRRGVTDCNRKGAVEYLKRRFRQHKLDLTDVLLGLYAICKGNA